VTLVFPRHYLRPLEKRDHCRPRIILLFIGIVIGGEVTVAQELYYYLLE